MKAVYLESNFGSRYRDTLTTLTAATMAMYIDIHRTQSYKAKTSTTVYKIWSYSLGGLLRTTIHIDQLKILKSPRLFWHNNLCIFWSWSQPLGNHPVQVFLVGGQPVPLASLSLTETTTLLLAAIFLTFSKQLSQIGLHNSKKRVTFLA